ncbi:MAG TPA: CUAEP/CCAEP-tail radical SAM protein [Roseiflexaceae bacterium]|nr:CUAEP/CCAEP-tail radical SAM protein [Roseiflexaceae bacterium]
MMQIVLLSTYELGHQPFGLASPAAWLRAAGAGVTCVDLAVQSLPRDAIAAADMVAFYVPMHTATRLAAAAIANVRAYNPQAHLCCFGLYAPMNADFLQSLGVQTILGGEFEQGLVDLYHTLATERPERPEKRGVAYTSSEASVSSVAHISLERQQFRMPDRRDLPPLTEYAAVQLPNGERRVAGYTEATRGCKHLCRHCPIVPIYGGQFRVVQRDVVLADIRQQVAAGAEHITFGDPDFFNGPGHAIPIVEALHAEFPHLTYDVTIKVEHLRQQARHLPTLQRTGCLFITSAVEAMDETILEKFDKRHTRADFARAVALLRANDLALNPTFVTFTPWTTREIYLDFLRTIHDLDLIENVTPIQYAIRLLIPRGSKLLELPDVQELVGPYDEAALCYRWTHPDPRMDQLYTEVLAAVQERQSGDESRRWLWEQVWELAATTSDERLTMPRLSARYRAPIPHMSEPWYC